MTAKVRATRSAKGGVTLVLPAGTKTGSQPGAESGDEPGAQNSPLELMLSQLSATDGGLVLVYRVPEQNDRDLTEIYTGKIPFSAFGGTLDGLMDYLRDSCGGGKFNLRIGDKAGHWKGRQFTVRVERPAAAPAAAAPAAAPAPVVQASPKITDNPHFGRALELGVTGIFGLLTAMATRGGNSGGGVTVADLVALQQANKQPDVFDSLEKLARVKELLLPADAPTAPSSGGTSMMDLFRSALNAVPSLLQAAQGGAMAQQQPGEPAALPPPQHTPESGEAAPESAPAQQQPAAPAPAGGINEQARQAVLIDMLLRGASNGSPAAAYAYMVDDALGPDVVEQLLAQPNPSVVVLGMFPALQPHAEWVGELVEGLRLLVAEQGEQAPPAAGATS